MRTADRPGMRLLAIRGAVVLALLWLHAWRDGIVFAFCSVAIPIALGLE